MSTANATFSNVCRAAVKRGAKLLDSVKPGWEDKINLEKLEMGSCSDCIVGQVGVKIAFDSPWEKDKMYNYPGGFDMISYLGFFADNMPNRIDYAEGKKILHNTWCKLILNRRAAKAALRPKIEFASVFYGEAISQSYVSAYTA